VVRARLALALSRNGLPARRNANAAGHRAYLTPEVLQRHVVDALHFIVFFGFSRHPLA